METVFCRMRGGGRPIDFVNGYDQVQCEKVVSKSAVQHQIHNASTGAPLPDEFDCSFACENVLLNWTGAVVGKRFHEWVQQDRKNSTTELHTRISQRREDGPRQGNGF